MNVEESNFSVYIIIGNYGTTLIVGKKRENKA